jgi:hypothetical protein
MAFRSIATLDQLKFDTQFVTIRTKSGDTRQTLNAGDGMAKNLERKSADPGCPNFEIVDRSQGTPEM